MKITIVKPDHAGMGPYLWVVLYWRSTSGAMIYAPAPVVFSHRSEADAYASAVRGNGYVARVLLASDYCRRPVDGSEALSYSMLDSRPVVEKGSY